ncbi:MAG: hypothetical protein AAF368_03195 [Planctomycetota bacterium]
MTRSAAPLLQDPVLPLRIPIRRVPLQRAVLGLLLLAFGAMLTAPVAQAQKPAKGYREFPAIGLKFKSLRELSDVPVNDRMKSADVIAQGTCDRGPQVKSEEGNRAAYPPSLYVFYDEPDGPLTGEDQESARRSRTRSAADYASAFHNVDLESVEPETEEFVTSKKIKGTRNSYVAKARTGIGRVELVFDVFTFYVGQSKMIFVWDYPADKKARKKWDKAVERSMKSLRDMKEGSDDTDFGEINSESSYKDLLAYHQHDVDQTPGWDLIETPSKNYLIKTNSTDRKDIKAVIKRLEASRRLFEEDFPPAAPITSVSVVRICGTREEFNTYGQTGGGVAGFFNPGSEELVLFFGDGSIEETMGVMTHEGFHQYCHFLFNRSEAHRWFDEGHGDYYGAWKMKGKNLTYYKDMKGGLSRLPHLKELHRTGALAPLKKHIRFDHGRWQNQGPQGISNYCQSFGLISFLRLGARKKVPGRYWEKEYAEILPNYIKHLAEGWAVRRRSKKTPRLR